MLQLWWPQTQTPWNSKMPKEMLTVMLPATLTACWSDVVRRGPLEFGLVCMVQGFNLLLILGYFYLMFYLMLLRRLDLDQSALASKTTVSFYCSG